MATRRHEKDIGDKEKISFPNICSSARVVFLFCFVLIVSITLARTEIGLIYKGPYNYFNEVIFSLYKYADISIPPSDTSNRMEIIYNDGLFYIKYKNQNVSTLLSNMESTIKELVNEPPRSVFVIAEDSFILTDSGTKTSVFLTWDQNMEVKLDMNGFIFEHAFSPSLGEFIYRIPSRLIDLEISGTNSEIILNDKKINIPIVLKVPPSKIFIEDGIKKIEIDLTDYDKSKYVVDLKKHDIYQRVNTKVKKVFEIESGIFFYGDPFSIWMPNGGEPFITDSRFYCDYGDIEEKSKTFFIDGEIVFAHENDKTIYLLTSSGHFVTLGKKNINRDFERAPMSIVVTDKYIQIKTFKLESYRVDFEGGIFKEGNVYNMNLDLPSYDHKDFYEFNKLSFEIKDNEVIIYNVSEE
jgi:hypothetical protein